MTRFITIQPIRENSYSITIAENYEEICIRVAEQIARAVREKPNCVLGLATGSSPLGIYAELIRMYRDEGLVSISMNTIPCSRKTPCPTMLT